MLELAGVSAGYGRLVALRDVSLEVPAGKVATVIGANGAGKTTLLRVISGLIPPRSGRLRLNGQDITGWPPERVVAAGVAHVPERRQLFGSMRVEDNLLLGAYLRLRRERRPAVEEDLLRVYDLFPRLRERRRQVAATLSGGEQQMLAIGRALMARPQLLLLDEPSLGLAPLLVRELFRVIRRLREEGYTVLLVEQNAHQALRVADVAYVMETGAITLRGSGPELLAKPEVQAAYLGGG
ncbi:MAG: ABC transporter ATP-binding protein [Armatimonadota bacterium]|nr:ABC transporter ATP-binding protein [Armatimonadota bacterium]MDR7477717.1 ABC transporter ATP-binding protein [Armatimonadota bacterium]MDR7515572.1 ABC transporter ATP-binding protein [Armatimonadota bacterium]MDR7541075.1 ABC transporter ATP-binding protein [Armatimonadota bacterium]MDR7564091.1 ABC transporter ATP-binding protein [Armatimonadota bacterium]